MIGYLVIAIGGALGSVGRYALSGAVQNLSGGTFPLGTMIVNISGALAIGFIAMLTGPDGRVIVAVPMRQFLMIGICGGYTTFSSFSLETLNLMRDGQWLAAGANAVLSVLLCLAAVFAGGAAAAALNR
jgi:CrcB protein